MKTLEALLESFDIILNKMNQYSRRNDVVTDGIPSSVIKRELEDKRNEVLGKIDIEVHEYDI